MFMDYDVGYFDDETCRLEPIDNPFGSKLLPMSPEWTLRKLEAPPGFEPGMGVLQISRVVVRVVSCWSLATPATPFSRVFGLRLDYVPGPRVSSARICFTSKRSL